MKIKRNFSLVFAAVALTAAVGNVSAQSVDSFPNGNVIRFIAPFGPGTGVDILGRFVAERLAIKWNTSVYVENKPGATGSIGLMTLKQAPADGLTVAVVSPSLVIAPILSKNINYKVEDFRGIGGIAKGHIGFFVRADSPHKSLEDALAHASKTNRPLAMGSYAGSYQLGAAWLSNLANVPITNIPYRGGAQAVSDLIGGSLESMTADYLSMLPMVRDGKIRVLATASDERVSGAPDIPTVKESYPEYVNFIWAGLVVRAETPDPVVQKLSDAVWEIMNEQQTKDYLANLGWEPMDYDAVSMSRFIAEEEARFLDVAKKAGVEPQ